MAKAKRAKKTAPKKSASKAKGGRRAGNGGGTNKTALVLGFPRELPAKAVVEQAAAQGVTVSAAYVNTIRSMANRKARKAGGAPSAPVAKRGPGRPKGSSAPRASGRVGGSADDTLVQAILAVGTSRAREVLAHVERELGRIKAPG